MNNNKILAIFLGLIAVTVLAWGLFNLLVEQHTYNGPTPLVTIIALPLLLKAYQIYRKNSKSQKS